MQLAARQPDLRIVTNTMPGCRFTTVYNSHSNHKYYLTGEKAVRPLVDQMLHS